jgi:uncharacterized protein YPO0396
VTATHPHAYLSELVDESLDGTRLERVDLFNWGTFDGKIWTLYAGRQSTLLTGDIGSGKSSFIDAVTALVVQANRVVFNKAAGADKDERDLYTYARGACGKTLDPQSGEELKRYLRKAGGAPTVIQAVFRRSDGSCTTAGLILTFTSTDATRPARNYYLVGRAVSIGELLSTGRDLKGIRASLRADGGEVWPDNFGAYQKALCKALTTTPSALALLTHTVSMKEVSNLTTFVRNHMLEPTFMSSRIQQMLDFYSNCSRAHDVVVDVRRQIEFLAEVERYGTLLDNALSRMSAVDVAERALANRVNLHRQELLRDAIAGEEAEVPRLQAKVAETKGRRDQVAQQISTVQRSLDGSGGPEITVAENALTAAEQQLQSTLAAASALKELARRLERPAPRSAEDFEAFRTTAQSVLDNAGTLQQEGLQAYSQVDAALKAIQKEVGETDAALAQTTSKLSNIDVKYQRVRDSLCAHLNVPHSTLPFAGELLQVRPGEQHWEGALERLVHSFGVSLLVPEQHQDEIARWIDANHLRMLLVHYPVPAAADTAAGRRPSPPPSTAAGKLDVRAGTPFTSWLTGEVTRRYTHECVGSTDDFHRHPKAITAAGQIREGNKRIKDDRKAIHDRLSYVLGWDTAARIKALRERKDALSAELAGKQSELTALVAASNQQQARLTAAEQVVTGYRTYAAVDTAGAIAHRDEQQELLETLASNPALRQLLDKMQALTVEHDKHDTAMSELNRDLGRVESTLAEHREQISAITFVDETLLLGAADAAPWKAMDAAIEAVPTAAPTSLRACEAWQTGVRDALRDARGAADRTRERTSARVVGAIKDFAGLWPLAVGELETANPESRHELIALRARLVADDLPAHEKKFRELLQKNTINEIASFHRALVTAADTIKKRIGVINTALADIEYTPATYISLEAEPTREPSIAEFRNQMRAITENRDLGSADDAYSEDRFLKVRALLDRFRGREGSSNEDKRWVDKVTDVRNWFTYGAAQRHRSDHETVEYYSDSDGKSGGQKEKLAYTILAASLAYQYGLADNRADTFRLVMVDEAFGRGSEASARYGMHLFQQLGLQILVATPLGKIRTIEKYVRSVGFAEQDDETKKSQITSMTLEVWQTKRRNAALAAQLDGVAQLLDRPEAQLQDEEFRAG